MQWWCISFKELESQIFAATVAYLTTVSVAKIMSYRWWMNECGSLIRDKPKSTGSKTYHSATLSTTHPTWTGLGLNLKHNGERRATTLELWHSHPVPRSVFTNISSRLRQPVSLYIPIYMYSNKIHNIWWLILFVTFSSLTCFGLQ